MVYKILMNVERKEAYLLCDGTYQEDEETFEYEYKMKNVSKYINHYIKIIASLKWDLDETIILYESDDVSYYDIQGYKELNFITYNKEHILFN